MPPPATLGSQEGLGSELEKWEKIDGGGGERAAGEGSREVQAGDEMSQLQKPLPHLWQEQIRSCPANQPLSFPVLLFLMVCTLQISQL